MRKIIHDKMSSRKSAYHFYSDAVKALIKKRGGWGPMAERLQTTIRTLERTVSNQSRNGRLQRDLLSVLRRKPEAVGYFTSGDNIGEQKAA